MEFSELEKSCMRALVSAPLERRNLGDLFADNILQNGRGIYFLDKTQKMELYCPEGDMPSLIDEMFTFTALIDYLKSNNYIYIHNRPDDSPGNVLSSDRDFVLKVQTIKTNKMPIDTSIGKDIRAYTITFFHPCTSLSQLVKNDFVTPETAKHLEQMNEARKQTNEAIEQTTKANIAIILSMITVLVSVIFPLISKSY